MARLFGLNYYLQGRSYYVKEAGLFLPPSTKIPETKNGYPVVGIMESAFVGLSGVFTITVPASVVSIEKHAFWGCSSVRTLVINGPAQIGERAFFNCKNLRSVIMPNVTSIGKEAFKGCKKLKSITLPNSLTTLDNRAFFDCPQIEYINVPTAMTKIVQNTFFYFKNVRRFHIHKWITNIQEGSFSACANVEEFSVDEDNPYYKAIDGNLYTKDGKNLIAYASGKKDAHFDVPQEVEHILGSAFGSSPNLKSVTMHEGVSSIGVFAFGFCKSLESITIPSGVEHVDDSICWQSNKNLVIYTYSAPEQTGWAERWSEIDFGLSARVERKRLGKRLLD